MDSIRQSSLKDFFPTNNYLRGGEDGGMRNNFAAGYYVYGEELLEIVLDRVRGEVEQCDHFQGFQFFHSVGGGTGSGFTSLLLPKLRDLYEKTERKTFTVFPSVQDELPMLHPYQVGLSMRSLVEFVDETYVFDNEAFYENRTRFDLKPNIHEYNNLIAHTISNMTSPMRFLAVNQVTNPLLEKSSHSRKLHFNTMGYYPGLDVFVSSEKTADILSHLLDSPSLLLVPGVDPRLGKCLSCNLRLRGEIQETAVESGLFQRKLPTSPHYVEWLPDREKIRYSIIKNYHLLAHSPSTSSETGALSINTTSIVSLWKSYHTRFYNLFRPKSYTMWFTGQGLDEMEFVDSLENLKELIHDYENT